MKYTFLLVAAMAWINAVPAAPQQPYAGQQQRPIKALSDAEVADYLGGKGMGFAKAAELNHYPGPRHVLDLADKLALSAEQRQRTQALFDAMQQRAMTLGRELVEKERALDERFATGVIDEPSLRTLLQEIGYLQAELRHVHLATHLKQKAILTRHQVVLYDRLRGYANGQDADGAVHRHTH